MATELPEDTYPHLNEYSHLGWIPCVSGHLDFCLIRVGLAGSYLTDGKRDSETQVINYAKVGLNDSHARRVVLQSWVDWRDEKDADGEFRAIVVGECNQSRNLDNRTFTGHICIFPRGYKKEFPECEKFIMDKVGKINNAYDEFKKLDIAESEIQWPDIQLSLNALWEDLNEQITSPAPLGPGAGLKEVYVVKFHVTHDGFIYLRYKDIGMDEIEPLSADDKFVLVRQAFYYIKYAIHNHNHHTSESDALTTIIPHANEGRLLIGLQLLGQLKRELVRIKRTQKENYRRKDDSEALGILGYMRTLLRGCLENGFVSNQVFKREKESIKGMTESFDSQHTAINDGADTLETAGQFSRQWIAILLTYTSLSLLLWVNVNKSFQSNGNSKGWLFELMQRDGNFLLFAYIAIGFAIWVFADTIAKFKLINQNPKLLRDLSINSWAITLLKLTSPILFTISSMILIWWSTNTPYLSLIISGLFGS